MYNAVAFSDIWLSEILVEEFDGVGEEECFGEAVDNMETAVVLGRRSNVENFAAVEVLGLSNVRLVLDDHGADDGSKKSGIKVEGAMKFLPCVHCWCNGVLAQEIEREFGLGK